jgi:uracil-DNA glycosylase
MDEIFTAFKLTPFDQVKVVVVGQDPYPGPTEAMGLSFSVHRGVKVPGSLRNIYKCLTTDRDVEFTAPKHGDLTAWAQQGVFMLNAVLTVTQGKANSHANKGWEEFTDAVIEVLSTQRPNLVFLLWGAFAQRKAAGVDRSMHCILEACHPSPLSASKGGFFTCGHFSKTNAYLRSVGAAPIDWNLS